MTQVFQQVRLMNPCKQVGPDPMLFIRENKFLILSRILTGRVELLTNNITGVNGSILIFSNTSTFLLENHWTPF